MSKKRLRAVHGILTMGIQERIDTRPDMIRSPASKVVLQQVVDVKSPFGQKFYRERDGEITTSANQTRAYGETNDRLSTICPCSHESSAGAPSVEVWGPKKVHSDG